MTRSRFEERQESRKDRLLERAERAEDKAKAATEAANRVAGAIPMGQPILVGHHSERRHRRDLQRSDDGYRKAFELGKQADELRRRAEGVGNAGISSDDPDARELLREKLHKLEAKQEYRRAMNVAWRRAGRPDPKSADGWEPVAKELGVPAATINEVRLEMATLRTYQASSPPFPAYIFSNGSAEIRRLKARIAELDVAAVAEPREEDLGAFRLVEDPADNRIRLIFGAKPEEGVRMLLKRHGFRWSPTAKAWQRHLNGAGRAAARFVLEALSKGGADGDA